MASSNRVPCSGAFDPCSCALDGGICFRCSVRLAIEAGDWWVSADKSDGGDYAQFRCQILHIREEDGKTFVELGDFEVTEACQNGFGLTCGTIWNRGEGDSETMVYNLTDDQVVVDAYVGDKYQDGAEGNLTSLLSCVFDRSPSMPDEDPC